MSDGDLLAYLFVVDSSQISLSEALRAIDKLPEIENWQTVLPDAAILISRLNIQRLNEVVKLNFVDQRYLLTVLERGKKAGWLAKRSWKFMNDPTSVAESEDHL